MHCIYILFKLGHGLDGLGLKSKGDFSSLLSAQTFSEAHPTSYSLAFEFFFPAMKRPGREVPLTSGAEFKNGWSSTSAVAVYLHGVDGGNFTVEIKCQLDATDDIYCRFYCLLNMFRAILCPSSGAGEYYTDGRCLWYLVLWFSGCRYDVELKVMCPVCRLLLYSLW